MTPLQQKIAEAVESVMLNAGASPYLVPIKKQAKQMTGAIEQIVDAEMVRFAEWLTRGHIALSPFWGTFSDKSGGKLNTTSELLTKFKSEQ